MERLNRPIIPASWGLGLLLIACAVDCSEALVTGVQTNDGYLYLYDQQGVQACSFNMTQGAHLLQNSADHGCPGSRIYSWRVTGARPGSEIMFYTDSGCDDLYPAYFFVISGAGADAVDMPDTTRQPIEHDGSYQHDIAPNVQSYGPSDKGAVAGAVKCVFISFSRG